MQQHDIACMPGRFRESAAYMPAVRAFRAGGVSCLLPAGRAWQGVALARSATTAGAASRHLSSNAFSSRALLASQDSLDGACLRLPFASPVQ